MRLFVRRDAFGRFLSCLVYLPRERFDTENRQRIEDILQEAFGGTSVDYTTRVSESVLARLHVVVYTEQGAIPEYDVAEIEARLAAATRAWTDDLRDALSEQLGEERAGPLFERYGEAFPGAYREDFSARQAVPDIERIERLDPDGDLGMSLYLPLESTLDHLAFKLLRSGSRSSSPTCCRCWRTWASGSATSGRTRSSRATGRRSGSTTSASATTRAPSSRPTTCARCSRTRSRAPGAASRRTTASTGSSSRRG